jgi:hypothetical protein
VFYDSIRLFFDRLYQPSPEYPWSYGIRSFFNPFGTINHPHLRDFLDIEFPLVESTLENMTMISIPWKYLHCGFCFLSFW